ncbi:hypothetical protein [Candidatus Frankia alpina]|uniref:hypothetical protein n=1 Tax=Candidatus Frankia alpina TaxID=2699483 RepID=UPI0013871264|nr:hypothetical protein [Candidatus Frankia alpina]
MAGNAVGSGDTIGSGDVAVPLGLAAPAGIVVVCGTAVQQPKLRLDRGRGGTVDRGACGLGQVGTARGEITGHRRSP